MCYRFSFPHCSPPVCLSLYSQLAVLGFTARQPSYPLDVTGLSDTSLAVCRSSLVDLQAMRPSGLMLSALRYTCFFFCNAIIILSLGRCLSWLAIIH